MGAERKPSGEKEKAPRLGQIGPRRFNALIAVTRVAQLRLPSLGSGRDLTDTTEADTCLLVRKRTEFSYAGRSCGTLRCPRHPEQEKRPR